MNRHYITIDEQNRITDAWSDGPHHDRDTTGAICINENGGYQFRLSSEEEENPVMCTMDGIPLYKWDGGQAVKRTDEELAIDRAAIPALPPTEQERLRADVDYIAVMTGVSL